MNEIIINNLNYDPETVKKAFWLHYKNIKWFRLLVGMPILITGLALIIFGIINNLFKTIFLGALIALLGTIYILRSANNLAYLARQNFLYSSRFEHNTYMMNSIGLEEVINNKKSFYKWESFKNALLDNDIILLYENVFTFRIFSQRYYTKEEFYQIKKWIEEKIPLKQA